MSTLGVGVIGTGFGARVHVPSFNACTHASVVAIIGADADKTHSVATRCGIQHAHRTADELFADDAVDIVSIAAPPRLHRPFALRALAAGKAIVCEKPLALDAREAREMTDAADGAAMPAAVCHQLRFQPNLAKLRSVIAGGTIGRPRHVAVSYTTPQRLAPAIGSDWWSQRDAGGGQLRALGPHLIDLLRWIAGDITDVSAHLACYRRQLPAMPAGPIETDDYSSLQLAFADGAAATVTLSAVAPPHERLQIAVHCEHGALLLDGFDRLRLERDAEAIDLSLPDPLVLEPGLRQNPWGRAFFRMVDAFTTALARGEPYVGASFADGLAVQRILDAADRSWHQRRWTTPDHAPAADQSEIA